MTAMRSALTRALLRTVIEDAIAGSGLTEEQATALRATAETITHVTFDSYLDVDGTCGCPAVMADLIEVDGTPYEGVEQNAVDAFMCAYDGAMEGLFGARGGAALQVIG